MPMLKLKDIIDKMEQIEDGTEFDGWDAWIELKDWFVKQKPKEADGLANWDDAEQSVQADVCPDCEGRGWIPNGEPDDCDTCNATGKRR